MNSTVFELLSIYTTWGLPLWRQGTRAGADNKMIGCRYYGSNSQIQYINQIFFYDYLLDLLDVCCGTVQSNVEVNLLEI